MHCSRLLRGLAYVLVFSVAGAVPSSNRERHVPQTDGVVKRAPTCHTSTNRACWSDGFDINTDYEEHFPATGTVREVYTPVFPCHYFPVLMPMPWQYNLVITEHDNWVGGDGIPKKKAMLINGQFPGL